MSSEEATSVRVALRIRPQLAREKIEACRICTYVTPGEPQVTIGKDKSFTYDYVFDTPTEQQTVYETCVKTLVEGCFEGYNATVLAYGQTGSGKTYTMGTGFDVASMPEQLGIIPRAMDHLFRGINQRKDEAKQKGLPIPEFTVSAQFLELYNEDLIDLFDTARDPSRGRSTIRIHEDANGSIYTVGVTTREVSSSEETLQCLQTGALNRTTAATRMNSQSSRSHAIFSVFIKQTRACKLQNIQSSSSPEGEVKEKIEVPATNEKKDSSLEFETLTAKFHFTDLAGSERLKRTGATGDRAKEGISINCGLLALGNVISALGDPGKRSSHVPYRDSKLTRLLQDSLGGNSCTLMVACISPSDSDFMETLSTLNYANRARNIKNKVVANQDTASKQIQVLRQQLAALQLELTEYKTGKRIVGEDGVEAYNDMFQENNILQKEVNNFRMKIKAMQETLENRNQQIISLRSELDRVKLGGADGEKNADVVSMVENYVKEIEDLRSKLVESEALCSSLRRRSDGMTSFGMPRSPTPSLPVTGSLDFENAYSSTGKSIIEVAKEDIDKLAAKKESLKKRKLEKIKEEDKTSSKDGVESKPDLVNGCEQSTTDEEGSELEAGDTESSDDDDDDDDDEATEALQKEFASITYEIDVKQQLVNELESQQRRISSMQRHYEDKLKLMAQTIRATELERDKILKSLDTKSGGNTEKSNKIKADYQRQIDKMKKEMNKLQEVKKKHDRLMREQSKHTNQLRSLRNELEQMKKTKTRLMKQMKEEQKKNKAHETKRMREITKLKREMKMKANEVRTLTSKNRQKDLMMKRKQEEVSILRKQLKPISGKYGKQQQLQQLKQQEANRPLDSTFVVDKNGEADAKAGNVKRQRKASSEFSSRTARLKLKTLQNKINEAVVRRETISNIDRQMERLLKQREQLQRDIERQHRKQSKAVVDEEDEMTVQRLKDEEDNLQQTMDFVNEQIQECQLEIMQVEEAEEDNGVVSSIVQYCSVNEARYIIENLISTTVSKSAVGVQMQNQLKDMETRLAASEESAKQAHDLMRYILQERPNLDSSIAECLSEYMKGAISDSASSRESSPDRVDDDFQNPKEVLPPAPIDPPLDNSSRLKPQSKEMKARRRTATPQELLHGMPSPIASNFSPVDSPSEEKTILASPTGPINLRSTSTPDLNSTVILGPAQHTPNGVDEIDVSSTKNDPHTAASIPHQAAVKSNSSPSSLPNPIPSESPPGSPVSSRMKSSVPSNVFSRLTTYALSSPRNDNSSSVLSEFRGRMNPNTGKNSTPRGVPILCSHTAEGHHKPVLCVEATEHLLFSGSKDRTVKVWNLVTCQEIMTLSGHPNNVNVVRYCPSTGLLYTVSLCYIKVWDIRSQAKCVRVLSSSGGHHLPSNFANTVSRTNRMPDNESLVNDVRIRDDGKMLFCATTTNVKIWDLNKFSIIGKLTGHSGNIMTMVVPPNKKDLVITGAKDHFIKVYDLSGGVQGLMSPSTTLEPPHMDGVESLGYSVDDNVLFSSSRDKSIKKWNMNTKAVIKSEYQAHSSWVCALDITRSDDGDEMLVSGGRDGVIKLWDLKSFGSIGSIKAHSDTVNDIASNKNNIFTASSDRTVSVWKQSSLR